MVDTIADAELFLFADQSREEPSSHPTPRFGQGKGVGRRLPSGQTDRVTFAEDALNEPKWTTAAFWVELSIFLISVVGALCIAYGIMKGFVLWLVSSVISVIYFFKRKQYPLSMQQIVFTITNVLGIVHHHRNIFEETF